MLRLPEKAPFSPLRSVRKFCMECQGGMVHFVRECDDAACALRPWRLPDAPPDEAEASRVLRGIRRYCFICVGDRREIRACAAETCPLWPYRFGVMPATWLRVTRRFRAPKALMLPGFEGLGKKKK